MIKAVILDCFGVLYIPLGEDFYKSHVPNYEQNRNTLRELDYAADMGKITQEQLVEQVAKLANMQASDVRKNITGQYIRNQKLLDFAQSLRPKYKIGLLSNINAASVNQFFTKAEREEYFDTAVLSGEVGLAKPNPLIFELVAKNLGILPQECLMVDDSPAHCSGAIEAGMRAIVFESTDDAIKKVRELL